MRNLVYYTNGEEPVGKRKHILFLEKSDFYIDKFYSLEDLKEYLQTSNPAGIILTEDSVIDNILDLTDLPILIILKNDKNMVELMEKYVNQKIFFRYETDPINTVYETARLIQRISEY